MLELAGGLNGPRVSLCYSHPPAVISELLLSQDPGAAGASQAGLGQAPLLQDGAEEPGHCHGTAPVDGDPEPTVAVVVYHLGEKRRGWCQESCSGALQAARSHNSSWGRPQCLQVEPRLGSSAQLCLSLQKPLEMQQKLPEDHPLPAQPPRNAAAVFLRAQHVMSPLGLLNHFSGSPDSALGSIATPLRAKAAQIQC